MNVAQMVNITRPWSFDTCAKGKLQHEQMFSACNALNHFDLHSHQGRGEQDELINVYLL